MNEADALQLVQQAIWAIIVASAPAVTSAMVVGIAIALLQALTQVQEVTLTFVPKIMAIMLALLLGATFMGAQLGSLTTTTFDLIERGF